MAGNGRYIQAYRRGLAILALGCVLFWMDGCSPETLISLTREEVLPENGSGERELALEEIESRAAEWESAEGDADAGGEESDSPLRGGCCRYAYQKLSESEQIWYRDMERAIDAMTDRVKLSEEGIGAGLDEGQIDRIFQCVLSDHPDFFYVEGYTYTKYTRAEETVAIEFSGSYSLDRETVLLRRDEIAATADKLIRGAADAADDYEKTRYVYETLITDTDYDLEAEENQNIYSVFVNHASVCQGYAKAAQYLLNSMGVECVLVQGRVLETGEGHAWNLVRMDGEYYYMDVTWGDISYRTQDGQPDDGLPRISYDYLGITTDQLRRTHEIDGSIAMPDCTAEQDNYYVREGAMFERYDTEQLSRLIERANEQGRRDITLRCRSGECYEEMCEALLERQEIFDLTPAKDVRSFAYTTNEKQLTLTFFMMTSTQ